MDWQEMYDILHEIVGVETNALDLAFAVSGCNEETACAILNYYTGWKSFEGFLAGNLLKVFLGKFEKDE